jgi:GT2 family glycosyltransferase
MSASTDSDGGSSSQLTRQATSKAGYILIFLMPLDWLLSACLVAAELAGRLLRRIAPRKAPEFPVPKQECSFVLLSWNSQSMLEKSLPALVEALKNDGGRHEVIIVDNHSTDGTKEFVRRKFPEIRLIASEKNLYFGAGTRLGIEAATRDILVLMNNDTVVRPGFLPPLLAALCDPGVFGVASKVTSTPGKPLETGNTSARFNGTDVEWQHNPIPIRPEKGACPVLWLHRGVFAIDRRKYQWLGGLDGLYDPLFLEDVDLSYRAWKVGWRCVLALDSEVFHRHHLVTPRAGEGFLHMIVRRNQYIFFWKNVNSVPMLIKNSLYATGRRMRRAGSQNIGPLREVHSFFAALKRLPGILSRRLSLSRQSIRSDEEVLAIARPAASNY